jgi:hypothetical protein
MLRREPKFDLAKYPGLDDELRVLAGRNRAVAEKALVLMSALLYGDERGGRFDVGRTSQGDYVDLPGCRALYFDVDEDRIRGRQERYRIIYREREPEVRPEQTSGHDADAPPPRRVLEFVCVGGRKDNQVFQAAHRLARVEPAQQHQVARGLQHGAAAARAFPRPLSQQIASESTNVSDPGPGPAPAAVARPPVSARAPGAER